MVYDVGGKETVCATVRNRRRLFRKSLTVKPTGACTVTSRLNNQKASELDSVFKVH
jgi:hypothetical protein